MNTVVRGDLFVDQCLELLVLYKHLRHARGAYYVRKKFGTFAVRDYELYVREKMRAQRLTGASVKEKAHYRHTRADTRALVRRS